MSRLSGDAVKNRPSHWRVRLYNLQGTLLLKVRADTNFISVVRFDFLPARKLSSFLSMVPLDRGGVALRDAKT